MPALLCCDLTEAFVCLHLTEWANSTAVEMDWNKLHKNTSFLDTAKKQLAVLQGRSDDEGDLDDADSTGGGATPYQKLRKMMGRKKEVKRCIPYCRPVN